MEVHYYILKHYLFEPHSLIPTLVPTTTIFLISSFAAFWRSFSSRFNFCSCVSPSSFDFLDFFPLDFFAWFLPFFLVFLACTVSSKNRKNNGIKFYT